MSLPSPPITILSTPLSRTFRRERSVIVWHPESVFFHFLRRALYYYSSLDREIQLRLRRPPPQIPPEIFSPSHRLYSNPPHSHHNLTHMGNPSSHQIQLHSPRHHRQLPHFKLSNHSPFTKPKRRYRCLLRPARHLRFLREPRNNTLDNAIMRSIFGHL
ncbi:hypothetical protein PVK06_041987 [Gossypium arboreum]|uniref:Uncharacterized protein n=1 Tax=Gossypium arboreum TaxID=29729 RepID=A0ABR0NAM4_GOSAR|nr:hypothetical protein PVK06_041987 [Gossypium arboreum]